MAGARSIVERILHFGKNCRSSHEQERDAHNA
jgi:hypothetical protein